MTAIDYAPNDPLDTSPSGPYTPPEDRRQAFLSALAGVELGAYDDRIIDWLSGLDDPTCRTIVSLIRRARQAVRFEPYDPCGEVIRELPGTTNVQTCMQQRGHDGPHDPAGRGDR